MEWHQNYPDHLTVKSTLHTLFALEAQILVQFAPRPAVFKTTHIL